MRSFTVSLAPLGLSGTLAPDVNAHSHDDPRFPLARISNLALFAAVAFAFLAIRRFATFHNETFDLAFYARLVWGLGHGDKYQPLSNSMFWGLHASPILFVLAAAGRLFAIVPMMLVVQAAAVAAAGIPLARIAARRVGHPVAADIALLAYLLYPTIGWLATYEFHPSALALLPLACALDFFDERRIVPGVIALCLATLCREDCALVAAMTGLALAMRREYRWWGLGVFVAGVAYFAVYLFLIAPKYLPAHGSLGLHYGQFGNSPAGVLHGIFVHPCATLRFVATPVRVLYPLRLLVPVAFLSLLAPRWLLPALVPVAINMLSQFPTATQVQSHYAALAVPFLFASSAHGAGRLAAAQAGAVNRYVVMTGLAVILGTLFMHHRAGATPLSRRWDPSAFRSDSRSADLAALLSRVPRSSSIAAPDEVLPHVAERPVLLRVPWTRPVDWALVSLEYRSRFGETQDLWRSSEAVLLRNTLSSGAYAVYAVEGQHVLLRRNEPPRGYARARYVEVPPSVGLHAQHVEIGPTLTLAGWGARAAPHGATVTVLLVANQPLPADTGFELGYGAMHPAGDREDPTTVVSVPAFDGLFSPVHVRVGEVVRQDFGLPISPDQVVHEGVYFGARRIDGSRLDATSAHWTALQ